MNVLLIVPEKRNFCVYAFAFILTLMHTQYLGASDADRAQAAALLCAGQTVALPSETVYGLAARADDPAAVAAIYAAKARPAGNPLIIHAADVASVQAMAHMNDAAQALAAQFWPGPLTLLLPLQAHALVGAACAGQPLAAVRVPAHPVFLDVLRRCGVPLAAPSANRSGRLSPTCAADVRADLDGRIAAVLDGGTCRVGLESTIIQVDDTGRVRILRPGVLSADDFTAAGFALASAASAATVQTPGSVHPHYAPGCPVRLNVTDPLPGEALLAFGAPAPDVGLCYQLSDARCLHTAARRLFAGLHTLAAAAPPAGIAVMPIPDHGPGIALNDRLRRAAAASLEPANA